MKENPNGFQKCISFPFDTRELGFQFLNVQFKDTETFSLAAKGEKVRRESIQKFWVTPFPAGEKISDVTIKKTTDILDCAPIPRVSETGRISYPKVKKEVLPCRTSPEFDRAMARVKSGKKVEQENVSIPHIPVSSPHEKRRKKAKTFWPNNPRHELSVDNHNPRINSTTTPIPATPITLGVKHISKTSLKKMGVKVIAPKKDNQRLRGSQVSVSSADFLSEQSDGTINAGFRVEQKSKKELTPAPIPSPFKNDFERRNYDRRVAAKLAKMEKERNQK